MYQFDLPHLGTDNILTSSEFPIFSHPFFFIFVFNLPAMDFDVFSKFAAFLFFQISLNLCSQSLYSIIAFWNFFPLSLSF